MAYIGPKRTDPFYLSTEWRDLRRKVLKRDGFCCVWCGNSVRGKGQSRVDHIQTRRERPDLQLDIRNLRTLCVNCDAKRHRDKAKGSIPRKECDENGFPEEWR